MEIRTERRAVVGAGAEDVWAALVAIDRYPHRWPWLLELDWRGGFTDGAGCRCRVRSPFGYSVRFAVVLDHVEPGCLVAATVTGDVVGSARLTLAPVAGSASPPGTPKGAPTEIRLVTALRPERRLLRVLDRLLPPVARVGHDRLMRSGMARFAADVTSHDDP